MRLGVLLVKVAWVVRPFEVILVKIFSGVYLSSRCHLGQGCSRNAEALLVKVLPGELARP